MSHKSKLLMSSILISIIVIVLVITADHYFIKEIKPKFVLGEYMVVTIEGCDYFLGINRELYHKGNCRNSIHNCK